MTTVKKIHVSTKTVTIKKRYERLQEINSQSLYDIKLFIQDML